ncbi:multicopper oxidase family protein [Actinomadura rugatobispora]|uniref:Multicopper oxidase family protein n=1 Tax=Actinomadura rugatobispora TaxID=1994 RepID=A0ABW1AJJ2_9ACTN|nr:multicopper oxidase domain-containing protein [Actinomadura rugatobispora]
MKRRRFLAAAGLAGLGTGCGQASSGVSAPRKPLWIPPMLRPRRDVDGVRRFQLNLRPGRTEFLPGKRAATWGVNGPHLGPTLRASRGDRVEMRVINGLPESTTLHWHGVRVPAEADGGPHQIIGPYGMWVPEWTIDQPAASAWYHPHPHGRTELHIYRGIAGMFLIDAPDAPDALPRAYGVDDIPLIIQDRTFRADGSLDEAALYQDRFGFEGQTVLVNGTYRPLLRVGAARVRFRLLNASSARVYQVGFTDGRRFHLIATDVGLLAAPLEVDRVQLSPGERAEVLVDFAAGDRVTLNSLGEQPKNTAGDGKADGKDDLDLLAIAAAGRLTRAGRMPSRLSADPMIEPPPGARVRTFVLGHHDINGKIMDMGRIDEVVPAGSTEIWEIRNESFAHNFHIHGVAFSVLDVNGAPPPGHLRGLKDTVLVPRAGTVRVAVTFSEWSDPVRPYMFHCHFLRHEDLGMMGQFVVVEAGTEDRVPTRLPGIPAHHRRRH